eukprot:1889905-Ditylum_brightwellii.AAC.1
MCGPGLDVMFPRQQWDVHPCLCTLVLMHIICTRVMGSSGAVHQFVPYPMTRTLSTACFCGVLYLSKQVLNAYPRRRVTFRVSKCVCCLLTVQLRTSIF